LGPSRAPVVRARSLQPKVKGPERACSAQNAVQMGYGPIIGVLVEYRGLHHGGNHDCLGGTVSSLLSQPVPYKQLFTEIVLTDVALFQP